MKNLIICIIAFFLFSRCETDLSLNANPFYGMDNIAIDIEKLAKSAIEPASSEEDYQLFKRKFNSLSYNELNMFLDRVIILQFNSEDEELEETLKKSKAVREKVFKEAISEFGVPFSKLSDKKRLKVFQSIDRPPKGSRFYRSPYDCPIVSYPYRSCRTEHWDIISEGYTTISPPGESSNCQYELIFSGSLTTLYGYKKTDRILLDLLGESCGIKIRYVDGHTCVLLDNNMVSWIGGGIGNVDIRMAW